MAFGFVSLSLNYYIIKSCLVLVIVALLPVLCQSKLTDDEIKNVAKEVETFYKSRQPRPPTLAECQKYCHKPCTSFMFEDFHKLSSADPDDVDLGLTGMKKCENANAVCDCGPKKLDPSDCKKYCNRVCASFRTRNENSLCQQVMEQCDCPILKKSEGSRIIETKEDRGDKQEITPSQSECDVICPRGCRSGRGSPNPDCVEKRSRCNCPVYDNTIALLLIACAFILPIAITAWCIWRRYCQRTCCTEPPPTLYGPVTPNMIPIQTVPLVVNPRINADPYCPHPSAPPPSTANDDPPPSYASASLKA